MPKGEFSRPKTEAGRKKLSDPSGKANHETREAAASGKASNYTSAKITDKQFADDMRMRERGKGTAGNYGYITKDSDGNYGVGTHKRTVPTKAKTTQVTPGKWWSK